MLIRQGNTLKISGPVLYTNVQSLLTAGCAQINDAIDCIDLEGVTEADSAALALLFALLRRHRELHTKATAVTPIKLIRPPVGLLSLAALYGVAEYLPITD